MYNGRADGGIVNPEACAALPPSEVGRPPMVGLGMVLAGPVATGVQMIKGVASS